MQSCTTRQDLVIAESIDHFMEVSEGCLTIDTQVFPDTCISLFPEETHQVLEALLFASGLPTSHPQEEVRMSKSASPHLVTTESADHRIEVREGSLTLEVKHLPETRISLSPEETQQVLEALLVAAGYGLQPISEPE